MKIYDYSTWNGWLLVDTGENQLDHAYRISDISTIGYTRLEVSIKLRDWDYIIHLEIPEGDHMTADGSGWLSWEIWDAVTGVPKEAS